MTTNIRLLTPNLSDDCTLTVSPAAVATLPVTYLQDQTRARMWRSTSTADQTIYGDWATPQTISGMVLSRTNLTTSATLRLRLYSGAAQTGSLLYDSTAITKAGDLSWGYRDFPMWFTATASVRSFSLVVSDSSNASGYVQASRLVIGAYFEPTYNISFGISLEWAESSKQERTDGGTLRTDGKLPYRIWRFKFGWLNESERASLLEVVRNIGLREDFYVSVFYTDGGVKERDYAGVVKITSMPKIIHDRVGNFATDLVLEEA